jgi:hypothetical protein
MALVSGAMALLTLSGFAGYALVAAATMAWSVLDDGHAGATPAVG